MIALDRVACRAAGRWVLRDVSLGVQAGEVFGLSGPSGGGKSLLLAICATLVRPDAGGVRLAGHDARAEAAAVRRLIGYLPEEIGWDPRMTVREDLEFFAGAHGLPRALRRDAATGALRRWHLGPAAGEPMGRLSLGLARRVALARAWLPGPPVLLLDQPALGLDAEGRDLLWAELRRHADGGGSALVVSARADDLATIAHRVGTLAGGSLASGEGVVPATTPVAEAGA